jgi:hypothetical protein
MMSKPKVIRKEYPVAHWYAWHPVKLLSGRWAWLETVLRTRITICVLGDEQLGSTNCTYTEAVND